MFAWAFPPVGQSSRWGGTAGLPRLLAFRSAVAVLRTAPISSSLTLEGGVEDHSRRSVRGRGR